MARGLLESAAPLQSATNSGSAVANGSLGCASAPAPVATAKTATIDPSFDMQSPNTPVSDSKRLEETNGSAFFSE
jgi:hypothetical protein